MSSHYIGRFAPSPTGPLHFGSLMAAVASYLDARCHQGKWLLRIEDIDPPRQDPRAISLILQSLEDFHLHWDGDVLYQSTRSAAYEDALHQLQTLDAVFPCACTRKMMANKLHQGRCEPVVPGSSHAWRFLADPSYTSFDDQIQGQYLAPQGIGDFIIRRRDQLWSYQLAVVVDDDYQNISHVVRGIDLIDSTLYQQQLQNCLDYQTLAYAHIPVAVDGQQCKLSKQAHAMAIQADTTGQTLWWALHCLQQQPPPELQQAGNEVLLSWAEQHWQLDTMTGQQQVETPPAFLQNPVR